MQEVEVSEPKKRMSAAKIAGIIAIILLVAIGAWSASQFGPVLSEKVKRLTAAVVSLVKSEEKIAVTADNKEIYSGEKASISWVNKAENAEGTYYLTYDCVDGVYLDIETFSGPKFITCNKQYELSSLIGDETSAVVTVLSEKEDEVELPIQIEFSSATGTANRTTKASGRISLTIINEELRPATSTEPVATTTGPVAVNEPDETPTTPAQPQPGYKPVTPITKGEETSNLYPVGSSTTTINTIPATPADLEVKIIEVGVVNKSTGLFTSTSTITDDVRFAVRFQVKNTGGQRSGEWYFTAVLPTFPQNIFTSPVQQSLGYQERIEYTMGFDDVLTNRDGVVTITADPYGRIAEPNEINNIATVTIHPIQK